MHTSADGFVATADGQMWPGFGWPPAAQEAMNDLYRDSGAVVYGRGIYEAVVPFWTRVAETGEMNGEPAGDHDRTFAALLASLSKYVVSHTLEPDIEGVKAIREDVPTRVAELKRETDGKVVLLCGGSLAGELVSANLIDELFLLIGPVALGQGRPLIETVEPVPTLIEQVENFGTTCTLIRSSVSSQMPDYKAEAGL
jgi:dihydrofolate reductase